MKMKLILTLATAFIIAGCVTSHPQITTDPATGVMTTNDVYSPDTNKINDLVGKGQAGTQVVAAFYPPASLASPLIGLVGGIATIISGFIAAKKNGQLKTTTGVLNAVVQGVEDLPAEIAGPAKEAIQRSATLSGVQPELHAVVQSQT